MEAKIEWKITWHCCMCCNPAKGRVDFEDGCLVKSSFITKDEMKACQLTRTKLPHKKLLLLLIASVSYQALLGTILLYNCEIVPCRLI
jgi:hypothetical protein